MLIPSDAVGVLARNATTMASASAKLAILSARTDSECDTLGRCRTIWNIIWSCLVTIFACVWVAIHPNIPQPKGPAEELGLSAQTAPQGRDWRHRACFKARHLLRVKLRAAYSPLTEKLAVALLALLAPEFIFLWAFRQWLGARSLAKECQKAASGVHAVTWSTELNKRLSAVTKRTVLDSLIAMGDELSLDSWHKRQLWLDSRAPVPAADKGAVENHTSNPSGPAARVTNDVGDACSSESDNELLDNLHLTVTRRQSMVDNTRLFYHHGRLSRLRWRPPSLLSLPGKCHRTHKGGANHPSMRGRHQGSK